MGMIAEELISLEDYALSVVYGAPLGWRLFYLYRSDWALMVGLSGFT